MTIPRALPTSLSSALPGIHWSLAGEGPPLYFQSLEQLQPIRLQEKIHVGNNNNSDDDDEFASFLQDIPAHTESLFPIREYDTEERHFGLISLGLILLGHGYTDECHNLITPLSWPEDIHFAYGASQYHAASPSAQAYASYVHSLVHRKEGFHHGEFGMMGFANANYWSSATARSAGVESLPHQQLFERVQQLYYEFASSFSSSSGSGSSTSSSGGGGSSSSSTGSKAIQDWCQEHDMLLEENTGSSSSSSSSSSDNNNNNNSRDDSTASTPYRLFDNRAVHQLVQQVLHPSSSATAAAVAATGDETLRKFAEQVVESEIRILLWHCLQKAGFHSVKEAQVLPWKAETETTMAGRDLQQGKNDDNKDQDNDTSNHDGEEMLAQPLQQECMIGRVVNEEIALSATRKLSSAHMDLFRSEGSVILRGVVGLDDPLSSVAGIACRLLESPACRLVKKGSVKYGMKDDENKKVVEIVLLDTDLAVADMLARKLGISNTNDEAESIFAFEAVEPDDPRRIYVDPLFGARGDTPTTVIQWSKGTAF